MSLWDHLPPQSRALNSHLKPPDAKILAKKFDEAEKSIADAKSEKHLQQQLFALLHRRGHLPKVQRMDRKSNITVGHTDISFEVYGKSCHWEVKMPGKNPEPAQEKMMTGLQSDPNCAHVRVIRSYREGLDDLNELHRHLGEALNHLREIANP